MSDTNEATADQKLATHVNAIRARPNEEKLDDEESKNTLAIVDEANLDPAARQLFNASEGITPTAQETATLDPNGKYDPITQALLASLTQGLNIDQIPVANSLSPVHAASKVAGMLNTSIQFAPDEVMHDVAGSQELPVNNMAMPLPTSSAANNFTLNVKGSLQTDMDMGAQGSAAISVDMNVSAQALQVASALAELQPKLFTMGDIQAQASTVLAHEAINAPLGSSAWPKEVGQKIVWMLGGAEQSATLTLNPPDLGPLQVIIQVNNDMVNTAFISNNSDVRQALQDGLEHLRQSMSQSGMTLGQIHVSSGNAQGQNASEQKPTSGGRADLGTASDLGIQLIGDKSASVSMQRQIRISDGLVNTFA
ncbi:flagellar hook-length control protein FliK [Polynucleobacter aenigmaticus]|nr:flagellar hook-length control protein FliK [Polynucleobacter aenigmaticus]